MNAVAEEAAALLQDFVSSLDNLPFEVHHILQASNALFRIQYTPDWYANTAGSGLTGDWAQGGARVRLQEPRQRARPVDSKTRQASFARRIRLVGAEPEGRDERGQDPERSCARRGDCEGEGGVGRARREARELSGHARLCMTE